jgi:hypothetical protein
MAATLALAGEAVAAKAPPQLEPCCLAAAFAVAAPSFTTLQLSFSWLRSQLGVQALFLVKKFVRVMAGMMQSWRQCLVSLQPLITAGTSACHIHVRSGIGRQLCKPLVVARHEISTLGWQPCDHSRVSVTFQRQTKQTPVPPLPNASEGSICTKLTMATSQRYKNDTRSLQNLRDTPLTGANKPTPH